MKATGLISTTTIYVHQMVSFMQRYGVRGDDCSDRTDTVSLYKLPVPLRPPGQSTLVRWLTVEPSPMRNMVQLSFFTKRPELVIA